MTFCRRKVQKNKNLFDAIFKKAKACPVAGNIYSQAVVRKNKEGEAARKRKQEEREKRKREAEEEEEARKKRKEDTSSIEDGREEEEEESDGENNDDNGGEKGDEEEEVPRKNLFSASSQFGLQHEWNVTAMIDLQNADALRRKQTRVWQGAGDATEMMDDLAQHERGVTCMQCTPRLIYSAQNKFLKDLSPKILEACNCISKLRKLFEADTTLDKTVTSLMNPVMEAMEAMIENAVIKLGRAESEEAALQHRYNTYLHKPELFAATFGNLDSKGLAVAEKHIHKVFEKFRCKSDDTNSKYSKEYEGFQAFAQIESK